MSSVIMGAEVFQPPTGGAPVQGVAKFSQYIGFGDSALDSGYYQTQPSHLASPLYEAAALAGGGLPTSFGGVMNSVLLAQDFDLSAIPVGKPGGTNYAAGGAAAYGPGSAPVPSVVTQIQTYLGANGEHADPDALYEISGGGNDQVANLVSDANQLALAIEQLYAAGARYILLSGATGGYDQFRDTLVTDLAAAGVPFMNYNYPLGEFNAAGPVTADPSAYGITNLNPPAGGPFNSTNPYSPDDGGASLNPDPSQLAGAWSYYATQDVSPTAGQTDLYADDAHVSAIAQEIVATDYFNFIETSTPVVSETLTAIGDVSGNSSATFTYQWQRLSPGQTTWSNISGATSQRYQVQQQDVGDQLHCLVSYAGGGQTTTVASEATPAVVSGLPLPTVLSISAVTDTRITNASVGQLITITMATNVPVTVIGNPTLKLNDNEVATYASGSGSRMLTFTYTVQPDDVTADLQVTGLNLPGGSGIVDASGNSLTGSFTADLRIALNLTAIMIMNNPGDGDYEIYDVAANHIAAAYSLGQVGAPWTFVGNGTFQAGDISDMLLRNSSTGQFEAYYIRNNAITGAAGVGAVGTNWNSTGVGNFDGQSSLSELLLRNNSSGSFELYRIASGGVLSGSSVAAVGNNFSVEGVGNFSESWLTQMLMLGNSGASQGQIELYTYDSSSAAFAGIDVGKVGSNLTFLGCGDLLGDGATQMVMQQNNGTLWLYTYNLNIRALSGQDVGAVGSNFHVVGFGQFGTAGQDEMLMQNAAGQFEVYQYNASLNAFVGTAMGAVGAPWIVDGIAATDPPASGGPSASSTAQVVQAMASMVSDSSVSTPVSPTASVEMSSATFLTAPRA